jgi:membrane protease YdiL (CAAX protease family)
VTSTVAPPRTYTWPQAVGLHLLPGFVFLLGCIVFRPLSDALGWPHSIGFTLGGLLLVTPLQFGYLAWRGRGFTAGERIADAAGFRRRLPPGRLAMIVAGLVAFTVLVLLVFTPVMDFLAAHVFAGMPDWLLSSDDAAGFVLAAVLLNIVGDCVLSPIAEELYYRGHLMSRLPTGPVRAAAAGAALFAATHFWEPALIPFVFVVQFVLGLTVRRTGSIRVAIWTHIAVNTLATALTLTTR